MLVSVKSKSGELKTMGHSRKFYIAVSFVLAMVFATPHTFAFTYDTGRILGLENNSDVVQVAVKKKMNPKFRRRTVRIETSQKPGTIIIDSNTKYLYYVLENNRAIRYGVGVGRDGFGWGGSVKIGRKAEWPSWTPPKTMIRREAAKGRKIPPYMKGGINNPLGARAMYLYKGGRDTIFRIHGTNQPWTIGHNMSSGCIRMVNKDVEHLYKRAKIGTKVIVIKDGSSSAKYYKVKKGFFGA